jgi:transposase
MAKHYVACDRDQQFLLAVSMRDWLDEGHLAFFVIDVVDTVDTSAFHARHPNDGPGRPAYDPDMMLALLFYAYGMGVRSSRRIEQLCRTDAAYRVICGHATPDHATIARFLVDHEGAIEAVFVDVLRLCAAAGLVSVGTIAIDGTKIGADAALRANRDADAIRAAVEAILAEALATDASEDTQPGLFPTDELPVGLATRNERLARLQTALAHIEAEETAAKQAAEAAAAKARQVAAEGRKLVGRKPKDPHSALARAEAEETATRVKAERKAAKRAAKAQRDVPQGPVPQGFEPEADDDVQAAVAATAAARAAAEAAPPTKIQANVSDPDSRIMKTATGFIQGYNAQAAVNENQIVVAAAVTQEANDVCQYQPMISATRAALAAAGVTEEIELVLADAGYWSDDNAKAEGPDKLIATLKDHKQRRAARELGTTTGPPPEGASALEAMEHRLRTAEGAAQYAKRSHTVEPVFGDHKENRGYRRFRRRGLSAVRSEWALINLSHNLAKLFLHATRTGGPLALT